MEAIKIEARPQITLEWLNTERSLSPSSLKAFRKSPRHYMEYLFGEKPEVPAFAMGSLIDCLLTEPENFDELFIKHERPNMRTNAGKEEMAKLIEQANEQHKTLITQEDIDTAKLAVEGAMNVPMIKDLVEGMTETQIKLKWKDRKTGLPIYGRADMESNAWGEEWLVEIKTTGKAEGADPDNFFRDALKFQYDIQMAAYLDGYHKTRYKFPNFMFIVIETNPPYNASAILADSKFIEQAKEEWRGTLDAFRYCLDRNLFNQGYEFRLHTMPYFSMQYPGWHRPRFAGFKAEDI